jgi:hypothetical protein
MEPIRLHRTVRGIPDRSVVVQSAREGWFTVNGRDEARQWQAISSDKFSVEGLAIGAPAKAIGAANNGEHTQTMIAFFTARLARNYNLISGLE